MTQPVAPKAASQAASETDSFQNTASLASKLQDIPLARSEQVARAQSQVYDVQYPPEKLLQAISSLLALHINS